MESEGVESSLRNSLLRAMELTDALNDLYAHCPGIGSIDAANAVGQAVASHCSPEHVKSLLAKRKFSKLTADDDAADAEKINAVLTDGTFPYGGFRADLTLAGAFILGCAGVSTGNDLIANAPVALLRAVSRVASAASSLAEAGGGGKKKRGGSPTMQSIGQQVRLSKMMPHYKHSQALRRKFAARYKDAGKAPKFRACCREGLSEDALRAARGTYEQCVRWVEYAQEFEEAARPSKRARSDGGDSSEDDDDDEPPLDPPPPGRRRTTRRMTRRMTTSPPPRPRRSPTTTRQSQPTPSTTTTTTRSCRVRVGFVLEKKGNVVYYGRAAVDALHQ
jgi:hypothetical protein